MNSNLSFKKWVFYSAFIVLILGLWIGFYRTQVSQATTYTEKSRQNSIKMLTQTPVRGNIYDRNGILVVGNRPAFSLYMVRNDVSANSIETIARLCNIPAKEIRKKLRQAGRFQPVKIVRQIDLETLTWVQENILELPGVEWRSEPKRYYPFSSGVAHLLGTLGEIDENELEKFGDLEQGDIVGKKAVERTYDQELRGKKGIRFVKVDALGRAVSDLTDEKNVKPEPGKQLYLSIDIRLQQYADTLLAGQRGALVAMDTRTGEVLTLISKPDYDLNYFTGIIPTDIWNQLISDPHHPLYDRAVQSTYPPGSTYKMIAAIAALNEHIIAPSWKAACPGYFQLGRRTIRCWYADGHGEQDLKSAIRNSCNVYFYKLGLLIGIETWTKYSRLFHFGEETGIELTNENAGLVPSREYYDKRYGKNRWTQGMLANLAIGQGELLVTPLQMVQFVGTLANRGVLVRPHLGKYLLDPLSGERQEFKIKKLTIPGIEPKVYDFVLEGMRQVVDGGTGQAASIYGIPSAGKTGTAENPHGKSHAWFIGFAPYENPEIAICVLVENGGSGGGVAAPIAGKYLRRYFYYQGKYDYELVRRIMADAAARRDSLARADSLRQADSLRTIQSGQEN
ncbi:MAG: penicillin-binding protein 2 [Calditrichia bacterium]